mmetsp:Transcript_53208/g.154918  ORF Transcript_53208/g.154918 Transcript_53208/m.154918 type:complete len:239 (+) Transcript_53208:1324-2040(+)
MVHQAVVQRVHGEGHLRRHHGLEAHLGVLPVLLEALLQDPRVEADAVPHLVVVVVLPKLQQQEHVPAQGGALHGDLREGVHGRGADEGVLEDHAVVDEADVLGRLGGARDLLAQEAQDPRAEVRVLAVLDELAEVQQAALPRRRHLRDDEDDRVHEVLLELGVAVLAEVRGQEGHQRLVLVRILQAEALHGAYHVDLEDVADVGHEGGDLLHQLLHVGLVTRLEQGRQCQGCRIPVLV